MMDVYLSILIESLKKKSKLLDDLYAVDKVQSEILAEDAPNRDLVEENMQKSIKIAGEIENLDDGFESVYKKVRKELLENSKAYKDEIGILKSLISEVTEKSVKVMAAESRNRDSASEKFVFTTKKVKSTVFDTMAVSQKYKRSMRKIQQ